MPKDEFDSISVHDDQFDTSDGLDSSEPSSSSQPAITPAANDGGSAKDDDFDFFDVEDMQRAESILSGDDELESPSGDADQDEEEEDDEDEEVEENVSEDDKPGDTVSDDLSKAAQELGISPKLVKKIGKKNLQGIIDRANMKAEMRAGNAARQVEHAIRTRLQQMQQNGQLPNGQQQEQQPNGQKLSTFDLKKLDNFEDPIKELAQHTTGRISSIEGQLQQVVRMLQQQQAGGQVGGDPLQAPVQGASREVFETFVSGLPEEFQERFGKGNSNALATSLGTNSPQVQSRMKLLYDAMDYQKVKKMQGEIVGFNEALEAALNWGFSDVKKQASASQRNKRLKNRRGQFSKAPTKSRRKSDVANMPLGEERAMQFADRAYKEYSG
jgi:hypothetical protein